MRLFQIPQMPQLDFSLAPPAISAWDLIQAIFMLGGALMLAYLAQRGLGRLRAKANSGRAALYLAQRLSVILIIVAGVIAALAALGVELTHISLFIGALGVGVGLGLQQAVRNFMAGMQLLSDRSISIGDFIELENGVTGEIHEVGARATLLITNDNVHVLVPNSWLVEARVVNWTRGRHSRRIHIPFLAPFGVDKELVRRAVLEAARSVPFTMPDEENRRTQVWLVGFADHGLKFELVVWPTPEAVKRPAAMTAAYTWAIDDALRRHGLVIPLPQMEVRVAEQAAQTRAQRSPVRLAESNDAAEDVRRPAPAEPDDDAEPARARESRG